MVDFRLFRGPFSAAPAQMVDHCATINGAYEVPANSSPTVGWIEIVHEVTAKIFDLVASIGNFSNTPAVLRVHEGLAEALSPVVTNFVGRPMRAPVPLERPFPRDFLS